jgi:hypothetical protein
MREEMIEMDENFCWMCSSLLASVDVTEFRTTEAYPNDLINIECKQSTEENMMAME